MSCSSGECLNHQRWPVSRRRRIRFGLVVTLFLTTITTVVDASKLLPRQTDPTRFRATTPWSIWMRGGGGNKDDTSQEDQELDEYIEELISSVGASEASEREGDTVASMAASDKELEMAAKDEEEEEDDDEIEDTLHERQLDEEEDALESVEAPALEDDDDEEEADNEEPPDKIRGTDAETPTENRAKKRRRDVSGKNEKAPADEIVSRVANKSSTPQTTRTIPNAVFRFLLGRGRIGHVVIMICILTVEFMETYLPPLAALLRYVRSHWFPPLEARSYHPSKSSGPTPRVNARYAGFVSSDGTMGRTKQRRKQVRLADEQALEKLRRVGSVREAKYRHVSVDFMKRHRIGPFSVPAGTVVEAGLAPETNEVVVVARDDDVEESDVDWVVQALTKQEPEVIETTRKPPMETTLEVGMGTSGPSVTLGVEFGIGKKKKRRKTALDAAVEVSSRHKRRISGPRASDRDGGGGVMGRLRAASANSLMSRSLLGAYPGDAVPPSEAASADGVISLAQKYGYGDWSDDDNDGDVDDFFSAATKPRKVRTRRKTKRHSSTSTISVGFGISSSTPGPPSSRRRSESHAKNVSPRSPSGTEHLDRRLGESTAASSNILGSTRSPSRRRDVLVRAPLERLKDAQAKYTKDENED